MFLLERILNEQLFLLIIIATSTILISYCVKNRPFLLKSIALAHLKKTEFKFVSNNTQDQTVSILFWASTALQTTCVFLFLEETRPQVETEGMPLPQPPGSAASKVVSREKNRKRA